MKKTTSSQRPDYLYFLERNSVEFEAYRDFQSCLCESEPFVKYDVLWNSLLPLHSSFMYNKVTINNKRHKIIFDTFFQHTNININSLEYML